VVEDRRDHFPCPLLGHDLAHVARAEVVGHRGGERALVVGLRLEADGEGADARRAGLRQERRGGRRVDPARQERADRHVGHLLPQHRGAQLVCQIAPRRLQIRVHLDGARVELPRPAQGQPSVLQLQDLARAELGDAGPGGARCGDEAIAQEQIEAVRIRLARRRGMLEQRARLAGEQEQPARND
jgi:hypothetical protein